MPTPTPTIAITASTVRSVLPLNRLFTQAVRTHFTYFDDTSQQRLIREHSPVKLLLATLNPRRVVLTAYCDRKLVGYAIGAVPKDGHGQLYWLYVDPNHRGNNTGLSLLSRAIKLQQKLGATEVSLATHDHRRYYERQGFVWRETRQVDGVPLDIMTYDLRGAA